METKEIQTTGKRGATVCITIDKLRNGILIASANSERITERQFEKALAREHPRHTFYLRTEHGYYIAQADPVHNEALA